MKKINIITFLVAFGCSLLAQNTSIITEFHLSENNLSSHQKKIVDKLLFPDFVIEHFFIELNEISEFQKNGKILIDIPNRKSFYVKLNYTEFMDNDNYYCYGDIISKEYDGNVIFSKQNGIFMGKINLNDEVYTINHIGVDKYLLCRLIFDLECKRPNPGRNKVFDSNISSLRNGNCPVTILVVYTENAMNDVDDINHIINFGIQQFNRANARSGVGFKLTKVHSQKVDFSETSNISNDLKKLQANDEVSILRDQKNADIVVLLTSSYPGVAGLTPINTPSFGTAFSIIDVNEVLKTTVFPHEVGHIFGCDHQFTTGANDPTYNHPHTFKVGWLFKKKKTTILWNKFVSGRGILNFSNPRIHYRGKPTGVQNKRFNASTLINNSCIVANFFSNPKQLSGIILGPERVCYNEDFKVIAEISDGNSGSYTYNWSYSYDGFNYNSISGNSKNALIPGTSSSDSDIFIYIKLVVTDSNGLSLTLFKVVIATPCSNKPNTNSLQKKVSDVLYPNPAQSKVFIKDSKKYDKIEIYNLNGNLIYQSITPIPTEINVSNLNKGNYFVKLHFGDTITVQKLILK